MSEGDHVDALQADKSHQPGEGEGCVTRCVWEDKNGKQVCKFAGHNYNENGFNYQKAAEGHWYNLDIYNPGEAQDRFKSIFTSPFKQAWRDPLKTPMVWHMGVGPKAGVNFISGSWWPWPNNAHHIIPVDDGLSKVFKKVEQLKLLQAGKYNVNKGINVIYLPKSSRYSRLFQLPKHPKYHSTYSAEVRRQLEAVKDGMAEAADDEKEGHPELTEENAPQMGAQLHSFSARMRKQIKKAGELSPGSHLNDMFKVLSGR